MTRGGFPCFGSMGGVEEFPYIAKDFFTHVGIDRLVSRAEGSSKMIKIKVYLTMNFQLDVAIMRNSIWY